MLRSIEQRVAAPETDAGEREAHLLALITDGPAEPIWQRYHQLSTKRDNQTLSSEEYAELLRLSETIQSADVQPLEHMPKLAKLRGVSLRTIQNELRIPNRGISGGQPHA